MRKITFTLLVVLSITSISSFATDKDKCKKNEKKCTMGGGSCCKKSTTKAAMLKTKPAAKAEVKKA
ncbi:hypothetical protein [Mucilaginibacter boryungensis]|uniref:Uncharacterized protein n=1 Tax=Mucilaginibacter boryungensis TaxID=768480 RepID=A0ABR9XMN1_9SPHI|nr:hypothetical protein [Mucilaginibacter boryungensis]MBE9668510.1 hypothetical protein [Mucilaginibacter boryungensis]